VKTRENSLGHKNSHYCISISRYTSKIATMEIDNGVEEEEEEVFGFSRNYFLAKELGGSGKKSASKLSDIDLVDEQVFN
jgi:hypothetical protein